jgi:NAD(P)-dependent dehydrogenase (short-subunit alcohol dehydrogenase family)
MTTAKRTYLVTGASTGLGLAVSRRFAQEGAHVVMVCRSQEKGQDAVLDIRKTAPESSVDLMLCDLASLKSIYGFLSDFRARYSKLDLLFNNAAVMKRKRTITDDGFETMFQVNYLAPFLLSKELLGSLKGG